MFEEGSDATDSRPHCAKIARTPPNTFCIGTDNEATASEWLRQLTTMLVQGDAVTKFSCKRGARDGAAWFSVELTLVKGKTSFLASTGSSHV